MTYTHSEEKYWFSDKNQLLFWEFFFCFVLFFWTLKLKKLIFLLFHCISSIQFRKEKENFTGKNNAKNFSFTKFFCKTLEFNSLEKWKTFFLPKLNFISFVNKESQRKAENKICFVFSFRFISMIKKFGFLF